MAILGSTNAYKDFFDEDTEDFDEEKYLKKLKTKKIVIISIIVTIFVLFVVFTIFALTLEETPFIFELVERNDFSKDFTDPNIIQEYFPN